ncbi:MAG TPA: ABC transporter ATP-binding protein [Herpetosiphonaceae bacterium]|nr:ABC transporter ATP-binding protein [Herpetosiphonaceae bacterium]
MTPLVHTTNLTQRFGATIALDHLNLSIPAGAVYGFIGPNGAGKTTTMRILTTLLPPDEGDATVAGYSVRRQPDKVRRMLGFMPDYFGVYDTMRVWEYLDFFSHVYGIKQPRRKALIGELLDLVDLGEKRDSYVMTLSRGMKQRLSLARTMAHDPALLILDEPASGLDPRARIELRELLRELRRMGKTIMISSHILTELAEMCTHIGIIERGKLLASGDVSTIMAGLRPHKLLEIHLLGRAAAALQFVRAQPHVEHAELSGEAGEAGEAAGDEQGGVLLANYVGGPQELSGLLAAMVGAGFPLTQFAERHSDLEEVFMQVTQGAVA